MSPVAGFAAVFKALAPDHRVIAYDRAGYGASDPAPADLDLQLSDLQAILEEAGPSVLVGHSWGGLLAQLIAWEHPELVKGLVLIDPSHESFWTTLPPELRAKMGQHPSRTSPPSEDPRSTDILKYGRELATEVAQSTGADPHTQQLLTDACLSYLATDEQLFMYLEELPMIVDHLDDIAVRRSQSVWPQLPMVLLTATKGRPEAATAQAIEIQTQVVEAAKGDHVIVPDAGHYIHIDQPDLVTTHIRDIAGQVIQA